jgi:hypothetical protein
MVLVYPVNHGNMRQSCSRSVVRRVTTSGAATSTPQLKQPLACGRALLNHPKPNPGSYSDLQVATHCNWASCSCRWLHIGDSPTHPETRLSTLWMLY